MPVEFALRPRIRLREEPAPARRARPRLPKFALPALAYWLVIGGLVYQFVRHHDENAAPPEAEATLAPLTPPSPPAVRQWWRPIPAAAPPISLPISEPSSPELATVEAPPTEPSPAEPTLAEPLPAQPLPAAEAPLQTLATSLRALRPVPPVAMAKAVPRPASTLASDPVDVPMPVEVPALALPPPALSAAPSLPLEGSRPAIVAGLPSCEAALASASQDVDFSGGNRTADLPTQAIAAVLENGAWLSGCAVPEHTALDVCVAIKGGRVVGASVTSRPADSALSACVKRRASSLQFPYSPHLDLARTRF